ncbi:MAG TPA: glycosyltransferase family 2 protein [Methylophilus sp.]|nr:glycosyltransferase family 2 protein [Methylophilus sp.]HQQ34004.1 glycosyltransferase family 2 protein [Methylophilus sp.]
MMPFICALILIFIIVHLMLAFVLLTQVLASLLYKSQPRFDIKNACPTVAIIVPAHNEANGIAETLQSILPQLREQDRLIVVADNCVDDTAAISRNLGAEAIERHDTSKRGKGYALDYGIRYLESNPPQVVLIVDADCILAPDAIRLLSSECLRRQRPVQALYLMKNSMQANVKSRISEFAWIVRNQVRPLGMKFLGLPCQLMGTGMAFLWQDICQAKLASGHIVEDMKLGLDLALQGKPPLFLPDALVTSQFPSENSASDTQRTRWEHGHLSVIIQDLPKLFIHAIKFKNLNTLAMGLDLVLPPLTLFVSTALILSMVSLVIYLFQPVAWLVIGPMILLATILISVGLAWLKYGRDVVSLQQLCCVPVYMIKKIPIYIKFLVRRQLDWVRSKRD